MTMTNPFDRVLTEMSVRGADLDEKVQEATRILRHVQKRLQEMSGKVYAAVTGTHEATGSRATDKLMFVLCNGAWLLIYQCGTYEQAALDAQIFAKLRSVELLSSLLEELRTRQYNANTEITRVLEKYERLKT